LNEVALIEAFKRTNAELLSKKPPIEINFSGTTIVTVLIKDNKLICANLGDSRALLGIIKKTS
jgi:serine/threonine protein phosphatase PrpC